MSWLVYTLLGVLCGSLSSVLRRVVMKDDKSDAMASVIVFQFSGFLIVLAFALVQGFVLPPLTTYPLHYAAQAILWGLSSYFLFKASKYLETAEVSIIATFSSIVTVATALLFLHEVFTLPRVAGTVLIIAAVIFVSFQKGAFKLNTGILYALGYCLTSGIAITNDTFLLQNTKVFSLLVVGWLTPGLFLLLIQPKVVTKLGYFFEGRRFLKLLIMTLVYALGGIAFYYAIGVGGQASQVTTISQSGIILTTIIAAVFLRERNHLGKKLIAAVLVIVGVLLLS